MTLEELKRSEAILIKLLFDYKLRLWESNLTHDEKMELEYRFNLLEKSTFDTFKNKYLSYQNIGNV